MTTLPENAIAAVTHPEPYPYYAELVRVRPLHHDPALGLWVATSAEAVTAVLTSPACHVRPTREPVPAALLDTPLGDFFRLLVRQNDGDRHDAPKLAIGVALTAQVTERVRAQATESAYQLVHDLGASRPMELAFALPVHVTGGLLGLPASVLPRLVDLVSKVVSGLAPSAPPGALAAGQFAVQDLLALVRDTLGKDAGDRGGLFGDLARHACRSGAGDPATLLSNAVGLLIQSYEATAALTGNTLVALAREPGLADDARRDASLLNAIVREVIRHDAPVQNTRRFVTAPCTLAGATLQPGTAILVVLAAANRDPAANAQPERFDPARAAARSFTFGMGPHACPGETLATVIASVAVSALLAAGVDLAPFGPTLRYRPSANARIPEPSIS